MNDEKSMAFGFFLGLLTGGLAGAVVAVCMATSADQDYWQRACVERGVAQYDSTTGAWEWKPEHAINTDPPRR